MTLIRVILLVLLSGPAAWAQARVPTPTPAESIADPRWLREWLDRERIAHRMPALAAAVVVNGKVLAASAVGLRKVGSTVHVHRTDAFHLGSLVKPMSATMFGVLVDRGVLRWDMTMAEMFPELQGTLQPEYRKVTIAQLLSHSGGFPYQPNTPEQQTDARASSVTGRRYEYVKAAVLDRPEVVPGTKVIYSGGGIVVASAAERRTRQSYEALMQRLLFKPLGMVHAGFGCMASEGKIDGPWGHVIENNRVKPIPPDRSQAIQALRPGGPERALLDHRPGALRRAAHPRGPG